MLVVGTNPNPASLASGISNLIFEFLYNIEFFFETIQISLILYLFAYWIIFFNSLEFPELLININMSFLVILPKSPCEQSLADIENEGVPTDDNVDAIFDAINPLLPTPPKITFD